jgi:large subunit ribosomal protein L17
MRHKVRGRKIGINSDHNRLLRRSLITELFRHERIKTTSARAKAIRSKAEKTITLARNRGDAERLIDLANGGDEDALKRILTDAQARRLLAAAQEAGDALEKEAKAIAVHAQRLAARDITDREVLQKLFDEIGPRFVERNGGYTRILKLGPRKGDRAEMVILELVE